MKMNPDLDWQRRYELADTPWDKGAAAPALVRYLRENVINGRVLVPGCGRGHEVRALAGQPGTTVVGLDLAKTALAQARELTEGAETESEIEFILGDFLKLPGSFHSAFDWLVEHTCFCALEPRQRTQYVQAAAAVLKPGGKVFGIFYLDPGVESGPPFGVSQAELTDLFNSTFIVSEEWIPQESFPGREKRELIQILQKR